MEYLTTIGLLPISYLFGLKHTQLKIPRPLAFLSPLALSLVEFYLSYGTKTIIMNLISSLLGVFLGVQSQFYVITGSIACGKSTVVRYVRNNYSDKVGIIDSDVIAREVVIPGRPAHRDIVARFGTEILTETEEIDREKLGKLIFSNVEHRRALTKITSKYIMWEIVKQHFSLRRNGYKHILIDMPIFFEMGFPTTFIPSLVIVVHVGNEQVWVERLMERDSIDEAAAREKIAAQMPIAIKLARCDEPLDNSGSIEDLDAQTKQLFAKL